MIYQLSSPLQADPEGSTTTSMAGPREQPLRGDLSARGCSLHENVEAGPKMLRGDLLGTCLQLGLGCPFKVGCAATPLSSSLLRGDVMP